MKAINTLLVIAILLFATVMSWTYFAVRGDNQNFNSQTGIGGGPGTDQSDEPNFRTGFNRLLVEHSNTAATHLTNLYDGKDTTDTAKKLEDNTLKMADLIKQLGTSAERELFLRAFKGHIKDYENYTNASKANDQSAMNDAKENLNMHAMDFGNLVNKLMPSISEQRGTELMNDHGKLTLAIVDAHANGDTAKKLNEMKKANTQAVQFANELASAAEDAQNR